MRFEIFLYFSLFLVNIVTAQDSPCPNLFRYVYNGNQWHGVMRVPGTLGPTINLKMEMSLGSKLPTSYVGKIETVGNDDEVAQKILNGGIITYNVLFPLLYPIPKVTSIKINNQEYCPGEPEKFVGEITDISSISLKHDLTAQKNSISLGPIDNNIHFNSGYYPEYTTNQQIAYRPPTTTQRPYIEYITQRPTQRTTQRPYVEYTTQPQYVPETNNEQCGTSFAQAGNTLITSGVPTVPGEWPWLAALYLTTKPGNLEFICSGSLVSSNHIVTAAHCVPQQSSGRKLESYVIKLGVFNILDWLEKNQVLTRPQQIVVHPEYNTNSRHNNDIAIMIIETVSFTRYIFPVCLWTTPDPVDGVTGTVVGWGKDENKVKVSPTPKKAEATIVSTQTCRSKYSYLAPFTTETTLCAGNEDGTGPCNGDSGGGLYIKSRGKWFIRAVVSNNIPNPENNQYCSNFDYVIYSDTYKFLSWIQTTIR